MKWIAGLAVSVVMLLIVADSVACTGVALVSRDGSRVVARTMDLDDPSVQLGYVVAPRGQYFRSSTPDGEGGLRYSAVYGFVGIYAGEEPYIVEGINEAGLSAGMFFLSDDVNHVPYNPAHNQKTVCDRQVVSWILSQFASIDQVQDALEQVDVVTLYDGNGSVCWRISEPGGKMTMLEITGGVPQFQEKVLSVPLPQDEAPLTGEDAVYRIFRLLNAYDIPDMTRFASATDQTAMKLYYRTARNSNIRCLDLMDIDFRKVRYQSRPLDVVQSQPVEMLKVK